MYETVKIIFLLAGGALFFLQALSYNNPEIGKYFLKKEFLEDPEKMEQMRKKTVPFCLLGTFVIAVAILNIIKML